LDEVQFGDAVGT